MFACALVKGSRCALVSLNFLNYIMYVIYSMLKGHSLHNIIVMEDGQDGRSTSKDYKGPL
jgi:hypothetical protein